MPAIKIRARGGAATEPEAKPKATRKSAAKKPAAKRASTRKAAASAAAPKRRGPGRPRKAEGEPVRRNSTGVDPKVEARLLKLVEKAGDRRRKAEIEHKESVNALHDAAQEALAAGVSMAKVSDSSGISRQWLYKMGEFADRSNGGSTPAKAPAKRAAAKPAAKRTTTRKTASKTAAKPAARRRTRIRTAA
jgi:hypothetical protein